MTEPLSHKFMLALDVSRDRLYSLALAKESTPAKAESTLQKSARILFIAYAQNPDLDPAKILEQQLSSDPSTLPPSSAPMPADVWARLSAAIQIEAAKSTIGSALNPNSLLNPDPLLAPRRASILDDSEAFDLSPPSRFMLASAIAILIGIALTIYILTRPSPPPLTTQPASTLTR